MADSGRTVFGGGGGGATFVSVAPSENLLSIESSFTVAANTSTHLSADIAVTPTEYPSGSIGGWYGGYYQTGTGGSAMSVLTAGIYTVQAFVLASTHPADPQARVHLYTTVPDGFAVPRFSVYHDWSTGTVIEAAYQVYLTPEFGVHGPLLEIFGKASGDLVIDYMSLGIAPVALES